MKYIDKIRNLLMRAEAQLANPAHINPSIAEWRGQVIAYQNVLLALGAPILQAKGKRKPPRRDPKAKIISLHPDRFPLKVSSGFIPFKKYPAQRSGGIVTDRS